jgi:hypothetical protein
VTNHISHNTKQQVKCYLHIYIGRTNVIGSRILLVCCVRFKLSL